MSFEADTFHHQHAVTEQPLNPLLLELLQQVGAVAGQRVHDHSAVRSTHSLQLQNLNTGQKHIITLRTSFSRTVK